MRYLMNTTAMANINPIIPYFKFQFGFFISFNSVVNAIRSFSKSLFKRDNFTSTSLLTSTIALLTSNFIVANSSCIPSFISLTKLSRFLNSSSKFSILASP
ncbi:hypothetical protein QL285_040038 [Trifolium repens]|nr:hypothetical protein QL285_040038 [Trifolium repens]